VFPLNRHGKEKYSSISPWAGGEAGSGEKTKYSGLVSDQEFGRGVIKARLSDGGRKRTSKLF